MHYEYPFFSTTDKAYSDVINTINKKFDQYRVDDLGSDDSYASVVYEGTISTSSQSIFNTSIDENDSFIFIGIGRTQEFGGPHPNNYYDSFVISKQTKSFAKLLDVYLIDDKDLKEITDQVYEEHSEKDYNTLKTDIKTAINNDNAGWRIDGSDLVIWFEYEYITDASHGDGEYAAIIPMK